MCTAAEATQKVYSQKMGMKNRFMQHSERLKVIQTPFYGACGVSGLSKTLYIVDQRISTLHILVYT
jgi:hypothetical protein